MPGFTKDKWLNFVIDHYKDIEAINEIYDMAQKKLPELVNTAIADTVLGLQKTYFLQNNLQCISCVKPSEIRWFDPTIYDQSKEQGAYLCFEYLGWDELVTEKRLESPWIVAYYEPVGKNKAIKEKNLNKWITEFAKHETALVKKQIEINPYDGEPSYLAAYFLDKEVNIEVLKTEEELIKGVQEAVREFTSAILQIMKSVAKL